MPPPPWPAPAADRFFLFLDVGDQGFGGQHQGGDRRGVLQREASDLGWVDDAGLDHVAELAGFRVEAEVVVLRFADAADDDRAFLSGVLGDLAHGLFEGALHDVDADGFVIFELELVERGDAAKQRHAAAGNDAFLHGRAGGVHGVFDASLLFLQLGFGGGADFDNGHAADQLGQALLELFLVVVGGGVLDLRADLLDRGLRFRRTCRRPR